MSADYEAEIKLAERGFHILMRALPEILRQVPGARLRIAGTGPERQRLQTLVEALGLADNVQFLGRLDGEAVAQLLREADISINPSLVDNMPNSVLEALASGVPVVSTDVGGVRFVVEHERTALLVPPGDSAAMAQACLPMPGPARASTASRTPARHEPRQSPYARSNHTSMASPAAAVAPPPASARRGPPPWLNRPGPGPTGTCWSWSITSRRKAAAAACCGR